MPRSLLYGSWILLLVCATTLVWTWSRYKAMSSRAGELAAVADSLRLRVEEADIARQVLDMKREEEARILDDLLASRDDLRRIYEKEKAASDEAIAQKEEALRQSHAKETALAGEQEARSQERIQRRIAEQRADSISIQQRESERTNRSLQASKVAQNSQSMKGDPTLRGLMALYAARTIERSGGDVNRSEIVRALHGALDELERAAPPGISGLPSGPRYLRMEGDELRALGNDGHLLAIDPATWQRRTLCDVSAYCGKSGGRAFLNEAVILATDAERGIAMISAADGTLIARERGTPHTDDVTALAAFPGNTALVSGARDGRLVSWSVEGGRLRVLKEHRVGGHVRAAITDARSGAVVAVNGTERVFIVGPDGALATVALPDADRASCIAAGGNGEVLIGTQLGAVLSLEVAGREVRKLHSGSGQRVECIAMRRTGERAIAIVDGVKRLTILSAEATASTPFQLSLSGIPNAMVFGNRDVLYLSFEDLTIRRVLTSTAAMAKRVCSLTGRAMTQEEWTSHIGSGVPEPVCP